jgi:ABC-type lipoprotein export system ATPase subunit
MRIREITFNNVRSFRGEHRISFLDELTGEVQPVTVIAGTNGTGKTTILETVESLLQSGWQSEGIVGEVLKSGFVCLEVELTPSDVLLNDGGSKIFHLIAGSKQLAPSYIETRWPNALHRVEDYDKPYTETARELERLWMSAIVKMEGGKENLRGGLIYFPQNRHPFSLPTTPKGILQPPPIRSWISCVSPTEKWEMSLEGFFVWQNYLDLEASQHKIPPNRLRNFVQEIEAVLGKDRPISIQEGRVYVPTTWSKDNGERSVVRLDQLPSGEQQCLWLLGELARRRRDGAVIMVDEPETSLHPTLQRMLVYQLRKLAREWDCQLILATHSLEILRSVHESAQINLDHLADQEASQQPELEVA